MTWFPLINNHKFLAVCAKSFSNFAFGALRADDEILFYLDQNKRILSVEIVMELSVASLTHDLSIRKKHTLSI